MDARIDVYKTLALEPGDAHVIRNAGGLATQDALRSLVVSSAMLGTEAAVVIGHTDCGMTRFSNPELRDRLRRQGIDAGDMDFLPFSYVDSQVVESVKRLRDSRLLPSSFAVHGFVYEVKAGRLRLVA